MAYPSLRQGVLVAREEGSAQDSAHALRAKGFSAWPAPVSRVHFLPRALNRRGVQALAFTSRHGVRAFVAANPWRDVPAFAVGQVTAKALADAGFTEIITAAGEGVSLLAMLRAQLSPAGGEVVHVGGHSLAVDIAAQMRQSGFAASHVPMYRTRALSGLPAESQIELRAGRIGTILLYSAEGARVLGVIVDAAGCGAQARAAKALCLSPSVEKSASIWGWACTASPGEPSEPSLFALLDG